MTDKGPTFNPPPGWPKPPAGWVPPRGWTPDPAWPPPPRGWQLWITLESVESSGDSPGEPDADSVPPIDSAVASSVSPDARVALLEAENAALRTRLQAVGTDAGTVVELNDERVLQDVGIYRYHHPLENAVAYRERLDGIGTRIAGQVKAGTAIEKSNMFTFDGSLAKGRSLANDLAKLMLRAYNAEAENVVRTLRAGNLHTAVKRLEASRTAIAKLGKMMEMRIGDGFHALRIEEIELTADYLVKKEEEREIARAERERLREERKVEQELAAARERLEKERAHLVTVIEKLGASGLTDADLEEKLSNVDNAIVQNDYRAANIRAGYVYVISNPGHRHGLRCGAARACQAGGQWPNRGPTNRTSEALPGQRRVTAVLGATQYRAQDGRSRRASARRPEAAVVRDSRGLRVRSRGQGDRTGGE